ncbi:MAG: tRNA lysidine(34) synthetase TilS [Acidimicrobiaceae bacterium]|nr:tRNA lysidine(34) synthetase TilS [Acidimicrobiaceae bacterium]
MDTPQLLDHCVFPDQPVLHLAVSGGADSLSMALLALESSRHVELHHVDHHARENSGEDRVFVEEWGRRHGVRVHSYDVWVSPGANFEARARAQRRAVLPREVLTGHTADDVAETFLLNLLRGAATTGLGVSEVATMPLRRLRRVDVREWLTARGESWREDPSNLDLSLRRNRVRHEVIPLLALVGERDVTPLLVRTAEQLSLDREYLHEISGPDFSRDLGEVDCRELATWTTARRHLWLRFHLAERDEFGDLHPPTRAEVTRADEVVLGRVRACELSGGRRFERRARRLSVSPTSGYADQS